MGTMTELMGLFRLLPYALLLGASSCLAVEWEWQPQESGVKTSIRGLCAVDKNVCWFGTGGGIIGRTIDGGEEWKTRVVKGAEELEFRDVEAFSAKLCVAMSVGEGEASRIYRTTDGGEDWELVYRNIAPKGFFNGIAFWDQKNGILAGDPVDGRLLILRTRDGGLTWEPITNTPEMKAGEHGFAASGTHVTVAPGGHAWVGSGGVVARIFYSADYGENWVVQTTPMIAGQASTGIFSISFKDSKQGIAVGGDYTKESEGVRNAMATSDGGKTWQLLVQGEDEETTVFSFRSCVQYVTGLKPILTIGPDGGDVSLDGGKNWRPLKGPGFHTLSAAKNLAGAWAAGTEGRIARLR